MNEGRSSEATSSGPLTCAQLRLWRVQRLLGARARPNEVVCLRIGAGIELPSVIDALDRIVRTHSCFRSRLEVIEGSPTWIADTVTGLSIADIRLDPVQDKGSRDDDVLDRLGVVYRYERLYQFDLEFEYPIRACVLHPGGEARPVLCLTIHPLVATRATLAWIHRELRSCLGDHGTADVPEPEALDDTPARLEIQRRAAMHAAQLQSFPTDRLRTPLKKCGAFRYGFSIDAETTRYLQRLGAGNDATGLGLLAVFAAVAARYAQQDVICIGVAYPQAPQLTATAPRSLLDHRPVELVPGGGLRLGELVAELRRQLQVPFSEAVAVLESLMEEGLSDNATSYTPYLQIAYEFMHEGVDDGALTRLHLPEPGGTISQSDIELRILQTSTGVLDCAIEYAAALFEEATIRRFVQHFNALLAAAIANPDASLARLDILSPQEHEALLAIDDQHLIDSDGTIDGLFLAQALRTPDAVALIQGRSCISFGELESRSARLAARLRTADVQAGDRVGIHLPRSIDCVTAMLAVLRCGAVYVPLDTNFPSAHIRRLQDDACLKLVLHDTQVSSEPRWKTITELLQHDADEVVAPDPIARTGDDAAYVIHTSGSTGQPKGVIGTHRSVVKRVIWGAEGLGHRHDEIFCFKTRTGVVDHVAEVFQALLGGRPLVILDDDDVVDTTAFVAALAAHGVTHLLLVPFMLSRLLEHEHASGLGELRSVVCSGDILSFGLAGRFFRRLPGARLFNMYGLTETGADSTCFEIAYDPAQDLAAFFQQAHKPGHPPNGVSLATDPRAARRQITHADMPLAELKDRFLDCAFPTVPTSLEDYLQWLDDEVLPYTVNVSSSRFIGHMTSALPAFMSEISALVSRLNQNMVKIETSKSLTLLERQLVATLHSEFYGRGDYASRVQNPEDVFGIVVSCGSSANITAMWNARNRALLGLGATKEDITAAGAHEVARACGYEGFAIIASPLAHYSIRKAVSLLGIGERNVIVPRQDALQKVDLDDLLRSIKECHERRLLIISMVGIAGATETGTIDPLVDMARIAAEHQLQFHVDAAWGGAMIFSRKHRHLLRGIELADSITLCPHKQLYAPQGISLCLFKDPRAIHASSVQAVYQGRQGSYDFGQYTMEGSRPASFLALHAMFHILSRGGIGSLVEQGMARAAYFAKVIQGHGAFQLIGSPQINIVNYRYIPRHLRSQQRFTVAENREISNAVARIQERQFLDGRTFVSKTDILHAGSSAEKITVFRAVICNPLTTREDMLDNLDDQLRIAQALVEGQSDGLDPWMHRTLSEVSQRQIEDLDRYTVPIGKPLPDTRVLILDADGRLLPLGIIGEIHVGGDGLAIGYTHPTEDASPFVPDPYRAGAVLFRTGDFGRRLADGSIEFCGRRDRQVKLRGTRVELGEVEAAFGRLDEVAQCAVFLDTETTEPRMVAFVVLRAPAVQGDAQTTAKSLRRQLLAATPAYLIPGAIHIVETLPLTPGGKIDRRSMLELWSRAEPGRRQESRTEARVRAMCERILQTSYVDAADSFFEIGGNSIAAAVLKDQIAREFSVDLSLQVLFEHPRLEDIASRIDEQQSVTH